MWSFLFLGARYVGFTNGVSLTERVQFVEKKNQNLIAFSTVVFLTLMQGRCIICPSLMYSGNDIRTSSGIYGRVPYCKRYYSGAIGLSF